MPTDATRLYAVVTGDVVRSTQLSPPSRRDLHEAMEATSEALQEVHHQDLLAPIDRFSGDRWQMVLESVPAVLRAALLFRAGLRARMQSHRVDTRMALAVGTIDFIPGDRVSQGDGEAFRQSGRLLESMRKGANMRFSFSGRSEERQLDIVVRLVDALAIRWSDRQSLAVSGALQGWTQARIAGGWWPRPISQQAVAQHLDRASWSAVEVGLEFFEETLEAIVGARKQVK